MMFEIGSLGRGEILKAKNEISMVLGGRKTIAPIFIHF